MLSKKAPLILILLLMLTQCTSPPSTPDIAFPSPSPAVSSTPAPTVTPRPAETSPPEPTATSQGGSTLLDANDKWRGIGRINVSSSCTAVLIDAGADETAPAYVLSNGHCIEWLANGVITGRQLEGEVIFNYFANTAEGHIAVPLAEVVYSTMQGIDVAIIALEATLEELAGQEIYPFPIADTPLKYPSEVHVVGAPSSGLPPADAYLRQEYCQVDGRADVLEFNWHFYDSYRTNCQDIFGGSSGSPLFAAEENTIYALINTTVESDSACYLGAPCEIMPDGVVLSPTSSYATPVHGLSACFDNAGNFSMTDACPLPPLNQLSFAEAPAAASQPPLSWHATLTGTLSSYRYKTGAVGAVDCRSAENYGPPIALVEHPTINDPIPDEEGFYLLCVLADGTLTDDDERQALAHPSVAVAEIDTTPPQREPQLAIRETPDFFDVALIFEPPELSDYLYKYGLEAETDCAVEDEYQRYRRIPITIERDAGAMRLCVIGFDNAGNPTPPLDTVLDE